MGGASKLVHWDSRGHLTAGKNQGHSSVLCVFEHRQDHAPPRDIAENEAFIRSMRKCISHRQRLPFSTPSTPDRLPRSPSALTRQSQDLAFIGPLLLYFLFFYFFDYFFFFLSLWKCACKLITGSFANKVSFFDYFFRATTISGCNQLRQKRKLSEAKNKDTMPPESLYHPTLDRRVTKQHIIIFLHFFCSCDSFVTRT